MSGLRVAGRTARIAEDDGAWLVHDRAVERRARGEDIILLSIGDPDFDTPEPIRAAAVAALGRGRTHYPASGGEPALRAAVAEVTSRQAGIPVSPDQVVGFPGTQAALFGLAQCLFDEGDEVIVPEPTYVTYPGVLGAAGALMRFVSLRPERGFHIDPDEVARAVTPRTRALLINFPHNPTGSTLAREEAEALAAICRRHDLILISDEVYAALAFDTPHMSPAGLPGMAERTAIVSSLSKSHAMTGWRCGWTVTPPSLAGHLRNIARIMHFGVTQFVQDAAAVALRDAGPELEALRQAYERRARLVVGRLQGVRGLTCRMPEAGMYVFADVRGTGMSGNAFGAELLEATGVAVLPGEGFGPSGAGHVRITVGTADARLALACDRIAAFAEGRAMPAGAIAG
ncbi:MAG: aminotransferase class I/II-fold pyridoxal phosphate-dependent enzyme [Gemmatimonadales bacterium]|nr:aminotransferase class I/II-fold pyridoxal phosphate-dependent enzyme [Gemmatimonadales bacterium]